MHHSFAWIRMQLTDSSESRILQLPFQHAVCVFVLVQLLSVQPGQADENVSENRLITFKDHVKPIFRQHCLKCHGDDEQEAGINRSLSNSDKRSYWPTKSSNPVNNCLHNLKRNLSF